MIHNGGGFFSSYSKPDTLDTWSEALLLWYTAEYLQVTYLLYALSVPASKIFLEQAVFVFTESWSRDQLLQKAY